jgi:hypothetical protein
MRFIIFLSVVYFFKLQALAQCRIATVTGSEIAINLNFDKDGRLAAIKGNDPEEGKACNWNFMTDKSGVTMPSANQTQLTGTNNGDGNYIVIMGDEDHQNKFKISKEGKIIYWDYTVTENDEFHYKKSDYTYDAHGNLIKMVWDGTIGKTKDHGELTAAYNLSQPDILYTAGFFRFIITMGWQLFPMTNANQITSLSYKQTITVPEEKKVIGTDKETGKDIIKTIPEKNIINNISRTFSYSYNSNKEVTGITFHQANLSENFKIIYSEGTCD